VGSATPVKVTFEGDEIPNTDLLAFTVERDIGQPDMAAIVVKNLEAKWSNKVELMKAIEIFAGDELTTSIYKGEVVGAEAHYEGGEKNRLTLRAMNKMHRLLRKRNSITFVDKSDEEILKQVAGDVGLSLKFKHAKAITYKHVYQHNQTDLEFLRMRAARIGCHVWCVGNDLYVQEPDLKQGPITKLKLAESSTEAVSQFAPRLSSSPIVKKVTVKGWNPETKELIVGDYTESGSKLGKEYAVAASKDLGKEETFTVDHPIWKIDEAKALAKARLVDSNLGFITGELTILGQPKDYTPELGKVIEITASAEDESAKDPFNGRYYITGVTSRFSHSHSKEGGYKTTLRLARDAMKGG
jgi:phage protein D